MSWKKACKYTGLDDWVFASPLHKGRRPYWGAAILRKYIRPVAESIDIEKRIGWHTFRRTFSTLLRSVGAELKVMQEFDAAFHSANNYGCIHTGRCASQARCSSRCLGALLPHDRMCR